MPLDSLLMAKINGFGLHYLWLDVLGIYLAQCLPYILVFVFCLFLLVNFRRYWRMFLGGGVAVLLSWLLAGAIGFLLPRARPFATGEFVMLLPHEPSPSFPSTHAIVFFTLATIVCIYNKKAGLAFLIGAFLIGLARVFCGLHWPSDVLAGMTLGILIALGVHFLSRKIFGRM